MNSRREGSVSVVVPCYNEQEVILEFHARLAAVMDKLGNPWEVVYVNDGSKDETFPVLCGIRTGCANCAVLDLSRNYGKEIALTAGMQYSQGQAVVVIDADLQDPPELIPALVEEWGNGFEVVYARRKSRAGESGLKKTTAKLFYHVIGKLSRVQIPANTGDFRLLSRKAVDSLLAFPEQHRFMKGLFAWIGYSQKAVYYHRDPRFAGESKWNYSALWNFAIEGITSFSTVPLRLVSYLGSLIAIFAIIYAGGVIYKTLVFGDPVQGYPSLMVVILLLGSIQLIGLGVIGEYLGRVSNEVKRRPLYFLDSYQISSLSKPSSASKAGEFNNPPHSDEE